MVNHHKDHNKDVSVNKGIKNLMFESFVNNHYTIVSAKIIPDKFYNFMKLLQTKMKKRLKKDQELVSIHDWLVPMLMNGHLS